MKLNNFYASRFLFLKACLHLHICGTALLAMKRFVIMADGSVVKGESDATEA